MSVISRFFNAASASGAPAGRLGGFWTDGDRTAGELQSLLDKGLVQPEEAEQLRFWIANGYVVIPQAVDDAAVSRVQAAIDAAIDAGARQMTYWRDGHRYLEPVRRDKLMETECKVIDVHGTLPAVQSAIFAPRLSRFLDLVLRAPPLAFQTLYFERGSEQPAHQDTAFVQVRPPLEFMASWIALEDIEEGSGELMYYPGSHRLPHRLFGQGQTKALPPGDDAIPTYSQDLAARCEAAGHRLQLFRPRRGDALLWAADLAHGGAPRTHAGTRRSLVTHYCPAHRRPGYVRGPFMRSREVQPGRFILSST